MINRPPFPSTSESRVCAATTPSSPVDAICLLLPPRTVNLGRTSINVDSTFDDGARDQPCRLRRGPEGGPAPRDQAPHALRLREPGPGPEHPPAGDEGALVRARGPRAPEGPERSTGRPRRGGRGRA